MTKSDLIEILVLSFWGAFIAFGKILVDEVKIMSRVSIGRMIVGAGLSISAGAALTVFPEMSSVAVIGLGVIFGITGQQGLELIAKRFVDKRLGEKINN